MITALKASMDSHMLHGNARMPFLFQGGRVRYSIHWLSIHSYVRNINVTCPQLQRCCRVALTCLSSHFDSGKSRRAVICTAPFDLQLHGAPGSNEFEGHNMDTAITNGNSWFAKASERRSSWKASRRPARRCGQHYG